MGERLEELTPGTVVWGVVANETVEVRGVQWHGTSAVTLTYRSASGSPGERLLYRDDEESLTIESAGRAWSFDADGHLFRLASEARRIRLAHLFDPRLAVHLSAVEPLPHQIQAVYGEMLPRQPLRFLLADDPGAGKTIMAGLLIKELALRGDVQRCLVIAPGGLVAQWQDELDQKFGLAFDLLTSQAVDDSRTGNPFDEKHFLIARLDHLARNETLQVRLAATEWDLVIVDEAHRMAAHWFGSEVKETKRYKLGRLVGGVTRHLLLMTATPHNGKEEDFQLFMALLDADRFEGRFRDGVHVADVSDLMRRVVKEDLLRFDGTRLFPARRASTIPYTLTDAEARLYQEVTDYVVVEMNRADRLRDEGQGRRGNRVGFALTVLQRRLASSPEAIYQSLVRRHRRLEDRLAEERLRLRADRVQRTPTTPIADPTELTTTAPATDVARLFSELDRDDDPDAFDDLDDTELEELEEEVVDEATTARTIEELQAELLVLERLERLAHEVRRSGEDRKWQELASLLHDEPSLRHADGSRRKLIVFTEHRDTLTYLVDRLRNLVGRPEAVVAIHGGTKREDRRRIQEVFTQDKECLVLVATDAAGEGVNLQRAHLLVNYDLPWNPNRIEQRFGRVHRIGQTEVCHMWNLVAEETREGAVYRTLLDKLEVQRERLGGRVFDVLGEAFRGRSLRELLLEAIRYGDDPRIIAQLHEVIDERVGDGISELVEHAALAADMLGLAEVAAIRADLEEAEVRRLQPHYVRAFFLEAFKLLGGRAVEREPGRYEITRVPLEVRSRDRLIGRGAPVLPAYERICFERHLIRPPGAPLAELVAPGHPVLDAVIDLIAERYGRLLEHGAVLVDDADPGVEPRVLVYLEHAIADGRITRHGGAHVVSRRFEFVELTANREPKDAGIAPYLDLRPPVDDEAALLAAAPPDTMPRADIETRALDAAIQVAVPRHLAQVRATTDMRVEKVSRAVKERLQREIDFWDGRAAQLRLELSAGKDEANAARAAKRADDLAGRLAARLAEQDREQQLSALPPVIAGAALVVPAGLLDALRVGAPPSDGPPAGVLARERIERLAVDAVLDAETALGRSPEEMAHDNPGYDVRAHASDGHLLFIEVKGRVAGAPTVTVTRNEILFGLNAGDQHVLALVEVQPDNRTDVRYLRRAFDDTDGVIHFAETSRTFSWPKLWHEALAPS